MQLTKAGVMGFDKILNCDCNSEYIGTLLFVFASERYVGNVVNTSTDPPPQEVLLNVPPLLITLKRVCMSKLLCSVGLCKSVVVVVL